MHHVRRFAHSSAHEHGFNPWSQNAAVATVAGVPPRPAENSNAAEPEKDKPKVPLARRLYDFLKVVLGRSWINILLVFVPLGIALHFAGINPNIVFAINAIAVIPLAGLLTFATEAVAHRLGPTLGALLNVSFGNAVELIIFIIALVKNEIRVVQAALIGSILANLLLILGMAFFIGGLEYREQLYDSTVTQMSACLLAIAVLSLLIPTAFHASFNDLDRADKQVVKLSRGTSIILLIVYILYLLFQLKSHAYLYTGTPQHVIDQNTEPGVAPGLLTRFDSTTSSSTSSASSIASGSGGRRRVGKRLKAKLGRRRSSVIEIQEDTSQTEAPKPEESEKIDHVKGEQVKLDVPSSKPELSGNATSTGLDKTKSARPQMPPKGMSFRPRAPPVFRSNTNPQSPAKQENVLRRFRSVPNADRGWEDADGPAGRQPQRVGTDQSKEGGEPPISQTTSIVLLLISTALVALCAEFMVGSIEHLVKNSSLSEAFIGLIILPIVGNAAEHVTAVTVAAKNKLDLSLGVSLGSSIQIALFVTPIVVILGWILGKDDMTLYFNLFETVTIFVSTFVVNFLVLDGRSNYLEGALLCMCYVIIAVGAFLFPDSESQSRATSGPGG